MIKKLVIVFAVIALIFAVIDLILFYNFLFPANDPEIGSFTFPKDISIIITGDIMLGRSVMTISLAKNKPNYPFENVADTLRSADIAFGNLENPIVANCPPTAGGFKFCADPKMLDGLGFSGVDIVNIANNHTGNYGADGIKQTQNFLKDSGIDYVGMGNLVIKNVNDTKFGFLGFDFVDKMPKGSDFQLITDSKSKVDVLIIMLHWGIEYTSEPSPEQKLIAKDLVGAGADVVTGSHPHWVQTIDYIDEKPVIYSLGNFIFDQSWSEETKKGLAVKLDYQKNKLLRIIKLPIYMKNLAQPEWVR